MTSFGATKVVKNTSNNNFNVETTFKIQGQVYHRIGSLLSMPDEDPKFLQIYFMGCEEDRVNARCNYNHIEINAEKAIVASLEAFVNENNQLMKVFKGVSNRLQNDNYMIVIKADKVPVGEHTRRFNAPTINEIAVVIVGEQFEKRDIKIMRRDKTWQTIEDTHRSYDALQFPLIFWEGEDGYQINMKEPKYISSTLYGLPHDPCDQL
ncbi:uncharacterized protein LOC119666108 [Teleopsis dalmanni]|uniref:uncharacterized protein LOC119666108 n=1 Tax=Teleopsis dalmanni TaxID=139649 RepID=UPI0018CD1A00|nr:uncharacterized protein LOC119666108 [Teleopsis dalmanni]